MTEVLDASVDRFVIASAEFEWRLRLARADQWCWPTPCSDWNVRALVNHMTRGNLSYVSLLAGGSAEEFVHTRDLDALGEDPVGAYVASARACADAFAASGALDRILDYPLGKVTGRQALAVRTTDATIHTWDLARALAVDERLDAGLVTWIDEHLDAIYAGLPETPIDLGSTHRFFAAPAGPTEPDASRQDRLLYRMGRQPITRSRA